MIGYPELVGLAVLGISALVSGGAMLALPQARVPGACLGVGGAAVLAGALVARTGSADLAPVLWTGGGLLALPLAATAYPRLTWRHPVDFVALAVVAGAGIVGTAWWPRLGNVDQLDVVTAMAVVVAVVVLLHTWWKVERLTGGARRAVVWMALAGTVAATVTFFGSFLSEGGGSTGDQLFYAVNYASMALVPPAMYVGLRRPELVDVRGLVVRTAVLVTALIVYLALYATAEAVLELLGEERPGVGVMGVVAALAATTLHPMQVALRGVMDELLFGRRPDPLGAAGLVAERISDDPALALLAIREALVLPWAELRVDDTSLATSGKPVAHTRELPLPTPRGTAHLVIGLRAGDLGLTANDEHVLRLVAPLLAQTLHARALADDLQESREQTISAIEEERRRLRRDLHDGLGPRLSGIAFTSDAARNTMHQDPAAAEELLRTLRSETVTAIREIRRLVYAMRPPALDELGLVPAVVQETAMLRTPSGEPLRVTIDAPPLPQLPAAVEVAAYRIAVEALTNVARHTSSPTATVRLSLTGRALTVDVTDEGGPGADGQSADGPSADGKSADWQSAGWQPGVGISSMRERAEELGGTLAIEHAPDGSRVRAVLPLGEVSRREVPAPAAGT